MNTLKQIIENYHEIVVLAFRHVSSLGPRELRTTWLYWNPDVTFSGYEHSILVYFILMTRFLIINILFKPQSAFYPWSAVCSLHFTLSLHFTPGLQSAVCSLHFTLTDYQWFIATNWVQTFSHFLIEFSRMVNSNQPPNDLTFAMQ